MTESNSVSIDPIAVFKNFWQQKWLIIAVTAVFAIGSVVVSLLMPNLYRSSGIYEYVKENGNDMSAMSQLGQVASLAGLNLGAGTTGDPKAVDLVALQSADFLETFIAKQEILVPLFAAESYDLLTGTLNLNPEIYDSERAEWTREVAFPFTPKPSMQEAVNKFREIFSADVDRLNGLVNLSITFYSPPHAKEWLTKLVGQFNEYIRAKDTQRYDDNLAFLNERASSVDNQQIRNVLYSLIEQEQKKSMLAHVSKHYVFDAIESPDVPVKRYSPKRSLIAVAGTVTGFLIGVLIVLFRILMRQQES